MRFSDEKIGAARNFANKIWNASRFVRMNLDIEEIALPSADRLRTEDKWILSLFNRLAGEVRENIDSYELGIALSKLYDFIWDIFCDWYIELLKPRLSAKGTEDNHVAQNVIAWVLSNTMKLLHPFLPFITEEIWLALPHTGDSIMISSYPQTDPALDFPEDEASMDRIIELIKAVRNRRAEMNVPPSKKTTLYIVSAYGDTFNSGVSHFFTRLASASEVIYTGEFTGDNAVSIVTGSATAYIPLAEMIDTEKELARLTKELENTEKEIDRLTKKLSNGGFTSKAPAAVVEGEKAKLEKYRETLDGIKTAIANLPK